MHSGQLGHTEIFIRPPRPKNNVGVTGGGTAATAGGAPKRGSGGVELSTPVAVGAAADATADGGDEDDENPNMLGGGRPGDGGGEGANDRGGGKSRSETEEAWSCCGKTVVSAGRGCEPREPLATVRNVSAACSWVSK